MSFDFDGTGFATPTGWVGSDDGFLTLDRNGNGIIDNGLELFGNAHVDGFVALAELDENADGIISNLDTNFSNLKVWSDFNQDGLSTANEIVSLISLGVTEISLASITAGYYLAGNYVSSTGSLAVGGNDTLTIGSVHFQLDKVNTTFVLPNGFTFDPLVELLPLMKGYGTVPDLSVAISLDSGLRDQLIAFVRGTDTWSAAQIREEAEALLFAWIGIDPAQLPSRGGHVDAARVAVIEAFRGQAIGGAILDGFWVNMVDRTYGNILDGFIARLLVQVAFADFNLDVATGLPADMEGHSLAPFGVFSYNPETDTMEGRPDLFLAFLTSINGQSDLSALREMDRSFELVELVSVVLFNGDRAGVSRMMETAASEVGVNVSSWGRIALELIDHRFVEVGVEAMTSMNDLVFGTTGHDTIDALGGDDTVTGGAGNDTLIENYGNDVYVWNLGDGDDLITGGRWNDGFDTIQFGAGIAPADLVYSYANNGNGLKISIVGQPGSISIDWELSYDSSSQIDQLRFADGTTLSRQQFIDAALSQLATTGNDTLYGGNGSDLVNSGAGNDTIDARSGDDTITGGVGNDTFVEGHDNDTYVWNLGDGDDLVTGGVWNDGTDTIQFGAGITPADLVYSYANNGNGLKISIAGQPGSITMDWELSYDTNSQIDELRFADGTTLSRQQFIDAALTQLATSGDDALYGSNGSDVVAGDAGNDTIDARSGDDTITGGGGNDTYVEGHGNDTYVWNLGDGDDRVIGGIWNDGTDTIQFGAGIASSSVIVSVDSDGRSLKLTVSGQPGSITVVDYLYVSAPQSIDQIRFADGTVWDRGVIQAKLSSAQSTPGDDVINGSGGNDYIFADAGNDRVDGGGGDDTITGGAGNDTHVENSGYDTYVLNLGDGDDLITGGRWNDGFDTIQFGAGITAADLVYGYANNGNGLTIGVTGQPGSITIDWELSYDWESQIDQLRFADGTTLSRQQFINAALAQLATTSDDALYGSSGSDLVAGGAGNDTIDARSGDDTINAGTGNDTYSENQGNDIFVWNLGDGDDLITGGRWNDGIDSIQFGAGITPANLVYSYANNGNGLKISIAGQPGSITMDWELSYDTNSQIDQLRFADGTTLSRQQFIDTALAQLATSGNDTLYGSSGSEPINGGAGNDTIDARSGDDILTGGAGNDTFIEGYGNDTYLWNLGDGDDLITGGRWNDGIDTIQFGAGIQSTDLVYSYIHNGNGLMISVAGQSGSISMDWEVSYDWQSQIDQLRFADGTVMSRQQFLDAAANQSGSMAASYNSADRESAGSGWDRAELGTATGPVQASGPLQPYDLWWV